MVGPYLDVDFVGVALPVLQGSYLLLSGGNALSGVPAEISGGYRNIGTFVPIYRIQPFRSLVNRIISGGETLLKCFCNFTFHQKCSTK
jgi:hypothetical protein